MEEIALLAAAPAKTSTRRPRSLAFIFFDIGRRILLVALAMAVVLSVLFFPRSTDSPLSATEQAELRNYYAAAYSKQDTSAQPEENSLYVRIAKQAAEVYDIKGHVTRFAREYGLTGKKVLDIGSGRGYLQDVVDDYTGLDISPSARRFFHKRFVLGSATSMPFAADEFDGAWTIWVLEHVPNPQAALLEMRRVIKDGGVLFLAPAWDVTPWASDGYLVRPYSDFGWGGKLIKASIFPQVYFWRLSKVPVRELRYAAWRVTGQPTEFRYRRLVPNYNHYWMPDSDAVNSLDRHETAMWFASRGDECLNCGGSIRGWDLSQGPLILKIHKTGTPAR